MKQKGFTLLEIIVALFLVSISLVVILGLINYSVQAAKNSKAKLIASNLAQESIEIVRSIRDSQTDWSVWYGSAPIGDWQVQYNDSSLENLYNDSLSLKFDSATGLYQYSTGSNTSFYRKVSVARGSSPDELKVTATIKWKFMGVWQQIIAEDRLWRWQ